MCVLDASLNAANAFLRTRCVWSRVFLADLSTISHLNDKLIILTLKMEQRAFCNPQFTYISVTFLFTSNTHFRDRHMHFWGTVAFSDVFWQKASAKTVSLILASLSFFKQLGPGVRHLSTFTWFIYSLMDSTEHRTPPGLTNLQQVSLAVSLQCPVPLFISSW